MDTQDDARVAWVRGQLRESAAVLHSLGPVPREVSTSSIAEVLSATGDRKSVV